MKKKWILTLSIAVILVASLLVFMLIGIGNNNEDENSSISDATAIENMIRNNSIVASKNDDGSLRFLFGNLTQGTPVNTPNGILELISAYSSELGIRNPNENLSAVEVIDHLDGFTYRYQQIHEGIPVVGSELCVVVNNDGIPSGIINNLVDIPDTFDKTISVSEDEASWSAIYTIQENTDCAKFIIQSTSNIIYIPDEGNPYYAWLFEYGTEEGTTYSAVVSTTDKEKVFFTSNKYEVAASGVNSFGDTVSFAVTENNDSYTLYDAENHIGIYDYKNDGQIISGNTTVWTDNTEVDLITNFATVQKYVNKVLGMDSIDNQGVEVAIRDNYTNSKKSTNACWEGFFTKENGARYGLISFAYNPNGELPFTMCLDVCAHEYGHGLVNYYLSSYKGLSAFRTTIRSINEAYADIFACCVDGNWTIGESYFSLAQKSQPYIRSIEKPDIDAGYKTSMPINILPVGNAYYENSTILSHIAYNMNTKCDIATEDIALIWINSLRFLNSASDFQDVRDAVLISAVQLSKISNKIELTDEQIEKIISVFKDAGLSGHGFEELDTEKAITSDEIPGPTTDNDNSKKLILGNIDADTIQYYNCSESGNFAVIERNGKYGIIGYDGEILLPIEYDEIYQGRGHSYDYLWASKGDYFYSIDVNGKAEESWGYPGGDVDPGAYWYNGQLAVFMPAEGVIGGLEELSWIAIEQRSWEKNAVLPIQEMSGIKQEPWGPMAQVDNSNYALLDTSTGKLVSDFIYSGYDTGNGFSEGVLAVKKGDKWGFIDTKGNEVTDFLYDPYEQNDVYEDMEYKYSIFTTTNGYIAVLKDSKWGLIDTQGNTVVEATYDGISQVNPDGMFWLKENGTWSLYQLAE